MVVGPNDLTIHPLEHVRSNVLFPLTSLMLCGLYPEPLLNPHLMTNGMWLVIIPSMLVNSGIRRQQFLGVPLGAAISGGLLNVNGSGVVPYVFGVLAGNSGT